MLAIGKGAEQEILAQMRLLGSNNVMITPIVEQKEEKATRRADAERQPKRFSPGLTYADAEAIAARRAARGGHERARSCSTRLITREGLPALRQGGRGGHDATSASPTSSSPAATGSARCRWSDGLPVAIIGHGVRTRFFTTEDPIGKPIKVGEIWLTVVGVLADRR